MFAYYLRSLHGPAAVKQSTRTTFGINGVSLVNKHLSGAAPRAVGQHAWATARVLHQYRAAHWRMPCWCLRPDWPWNILYTHFKDAMFQSHSLVAVVVAARCMQGAGKAPNGISHCRRLLQVLLPPPWPGCYCVICCWLRIHMHVSQSDLWTVTENLSPHRQAPCSEVYCGTIKATP